MSGLDEQNSLLRILKSKSSYDYEKWIFGYLECTTCGVKLYRDVPWGWRRRAEEKGISLEELKKLGIKRWKEVYGNTPLYHNEQDVDCHGVLIFKESER